MPTNYQRQLFYLTGITVLIKLIVAHFIELGNDEVYYYTYALQPDWNNFDHPPGVGLLIRLTTFNLHWLSEVSMRLGAILGCAISTIFIFKIGKLLSSERMGWYAALVYNCSVYTGIISGLFILPDSPEMVFYTASIFIMSKIIVNEGDEKLTSWLLLGLCIGLACLCKIHGLYLWVGFGLFILFKRPKWILNYRLYAGVGVTLLCLVPIIYWNIQNDWITYKFHSARVSHTTVMWNSLLTEVGGEIGYQNPLIFLLIVAAAGIAVFKERRIPKALHTTWLFFMSVPMIVIVWLVSLFNTTLPHWSGPAYIPLFFIAAKFLESRTKKVAPGYLKASGGLLVVAVIVSTLFIVLAPFDLGSQRHRDQGNGDPTLDISGWKTFGKNFKTIVDSDVINKAMQPDASIICGNWFPAGHIEFYVCRLTGQRLLGIGPIDRIHKFAWLNKERKPLKLGDDAYCIVPSNYPFDVEGNYGRYFTTTEFSEEIPQMRGDVPVRYFRVYRLKDCNQLPEMPALIIQKH